MKHQLWKRVLQFKIKLNLHVTYDLATAILGILSKEMKGYVYIQTYAPIFIIAVL